MATAKVEIAKLKGEVWRRIDWIENIEGEFYVSNLGRVYRATHKVPRSYTKSGFVIKRAKLLKQSNHIGYRVAYIPTTGTKTHTHVPVHRLVARAFLPLIDGKDVVNHKDSCKSNNHVKNLEWCTHLENIAHYRASFPDFAKLLPRGERMHKAVLTAEKVLEIRALYDCKKRNGAIIAKQYGVSIATIRMAVKRITWKHI